ncbi:MAG: hypothetical protein J5736_01025, partial [Bacilli bacterium]|nr:hypothetical protein [Bacilli bacterium]
MKKEKTYAAFFVEGKTEMVFYRLLSDYLSSQADTDQIPIVKIIDMKGENHFPQKANAKALSLFIQKHPADAYVFFFCYDHDLYPEKPPV